MVCHMILWCVTFAYIIIIITISYRNNVIIVQSITITVVQTTVYEYAYGMKGMQRMCLLVFGQLTTDNVTPQFTNSLYMNVYTATVYFTLRPHFKATTIIIQVYAGS